MRDPRDAKYFEEQDAREKYADEYEKAENKLNKYLEMNAVDIAEDIINDIYLPNGSVADELHRKLASAIASCIS